MKNTIEAVKYGIQTLKVSPEEMFSLIETSNGYDGNDYNRWLANEIIKLAEKDGVGYSQLLVKKFAIISDIVDGVDATVKGEWLDYFRSCIGCDMVSVNFDEIGTVADDVDWYSSVDMMSEKAFSTVDNIGDLAAKLETGNTGNFAFVARLDTEPCGKGSDLFKSAKSFGIICNNRGALLLYRMCNFIEAWELGSEFKFAFLANTAFLGAEENKNIISYFLQYFDYTGIVIDSVDLFDEAFLKNSYAFVVCTPKGVGSKVTDCFSLPKAKLGGNGVVIDSVSKLYSRTEEGMLGHLVATSSSEGEVFGYLNVYNMACFRCTVSCVEDWSASIVIPITANNLKEVVIYFSVVHALIKSGLSSNIALVMSGNADYDNLFYNCLPLFLFDVDSLFKSELGVDNVFDVQKSDMLLGLLDSGGVYFSYEAKELLGICKGFIDYLGDDCEGLTFEEIRKEADYDDLNEQYITALSNMKDYIRSFYRKIR